jgi:hypothetical protein
MKQIKSSGMLVGEVMSIKLQKIPIKETIRLMFLLNTKGYKTNIDSSEGSTWIRVNQ